MKQGIVGCLMLFDSGRTEERPSCSTNCSGHPALGQDVLILSQHALCQTAQSGVSYCQRKQMKEELRPSVDVCDGVLVA